MLSIIKFFNRRHNGSLDKIDNAHFVFTSGELIDVYSSIGSVSNALRKPTLTHCVDLVGEIVCA